MPWLFLASFFPFLFFFSFRFGCCPGTAHYNATRCAAAEWADKAGALHPLGGQAACKDACAAYVGTKSYMGGIHPRIKKPVGERLAIAAMGVAYGAPGAVSGPTISGCDVHGTSLTIRYNASLLAGGAIGVKPYDTTTTFSAFRVLVNAQYWCQDTILAPTVNSRSGRWMCNDTGAPSWSNCGNDVQCGDTKHSTGKDRRVTSSSAWASVPEMARSMSWPMASTASNTVDPAAMLRARGRGDTPGMWLRVGVKALSATSVVLDLSSLNGSVPVAVRYAWSNERDSCCEAVDPTHPCTPAACPIYDRSSGLPGNPFAARINSGKCVCTPPQVCDEGPATRVKANGPTPAAKHRQTDAVMRGSSDAVISVLRRQ